MSSVEQNLIHRYFDILSRGAFNEFEEICVEDVIYYLPGNTRLSQRIQGRAAFIEFSRKVFSNYPGATFSVGDVDAVGSAIGVWIAQYHSEWLGPDRRNQESDGSVIFEVQSGRLARIAVQLSEEQQHAIYERGWMALDHN